MIRANSQGVCGGDLSVSQAATVSHFIPVDTSRLFVETVPVNDGFANGAFAAHWFGAVAV